MVDGPNYNDNGNEIYVPTNSDKQNHPLGRLPITKKNCILSCFVLTNNNSTLKKTQILIHELKIISKTKVIESNDPYIPKHYSLLFFILFI